MKADGVCSKVECTVATTGICLLGNLVEQCSYFERDSQSSTVESQQGAEKLVCGFHSGFELSLQELTRLSRKDYAHLVAILGDYDAGKTTLLASLYLMIVHRMLEGYTFRGSYTLPAFEERAISARNWSAGKLNESPPHTVLGDVGFPPLLHLSLNTKSGSANFFFTDLEGEWTNDLRTKEDASAKFDFLHRSDVILILIDRNELHQHQRQEMRKLGMLFERLKTGLKLRASVPMFLVLTKVDLSNDNMDYSTLLLAEAAKSGYHPVVLGTAAWPKVRTQTCSGLQELIDAVCSSVTGEYEFPAVGSKATMRRQFLNVGFEYE